MNPGLSIKDTFLGPKKATKNTHCPILLIPLKKDSIPMKGKVVGHKVCFIQRDDLKTRTLEAEPLENRFSSVVAAPPSPNTAALWEGI